jgi:hypothetical protein
MNDSPETISDVWSMRVTMPAYQSSGPFLANRKQIPPLIQKEEAVHLAGFADIAEIRRFLIRSEDS